MKEFVNLRIGEEQEDFNLVLHVNAIMILDHSGRFSVLSFLKKFYDLSGAVKVRLVVRFLKAFLNESLKF